MISDANFVPSGYETPLAVVTLFNSYPKSIMAPRPQVLVSVVFEAEGLTLDNTIGFLLISFSISVLLLGLLSAQLHHYYQTYREDRPSIKLLVGFVWFLDFGQTIFQLHGLYRILVTNFGDLRFALDPPWTIKSSLIWAASIYALVEVFFAYRIRILSGSYIIPILCCVGSAARFGVSVGPDCLALTMPLVEFVAWHGNLIHLPIVVGALIDTFLALVLSYYLYDRSRVGMARTQWIARRLVVFLIEAGIVNFLVSIAALIASYMMPYNGIWWGILFFHSKIYANALLLSLNQRKKLRTPSNLFGQIPGTHGLSSPNFPVKKSDTISASPNILVAYPPGNVHDSAEEIDHSTVTWSEEVPEIIHENV